MLARLEPRKARSGRKSEEKERETEREREGKVRRQARKGERVARDEIDRVEREGGRERKRKEERKKANQTRTTKGMAKPERRKALDSHVKRTGDLVAIGCQGPHYHIPS